MQPLSGNQRPDLLTALMNMSLVLCLPRKNVSLQILFKCPTPAIGFETATKPHASLTFDEVHNPLHLPRKPNLNLQKWSEHVVLLTWKCASRHNGVHFFDMSTSKSATRLKCFVHFDLEMCFAPQRRALFPTSQLPKVLQG